MLREVSHDATCDDVFLDLAAEAGQGNRSVVSSVIPVAFLVHCCHICLLPVIRDTSLSKSVGDV